MFTESNKIYSQEDLDDNDLFVIGDIMSVEEEDGEVYCSWKRSDFSHILDCFIYKRSKYSSKIGLPIPFLYPTKPSNHTKFLLHIVLSMGEFISEGELYSNAGSSIQLLKNANLLLGEEPSMEDVKTLTRKYILEQLLFLPKGTFLFDSYEVQSFWTF